MYIYYALIASSAYAYNIMIDMCLSSSIFPRTSLFQWNTVLNPE